MKERFRSWFVSRALYDYTLARAERAEAELQTVRDRASREVAFAFEQSMKSADQARGAIAEARAAIRESVEMSKLASKTLFGGAGDAVPEMTSISANDALVARKRREQSDMADRNSRA